MTTKTKNLRVMIYSSLFAALIAAGAFIAIPIGPVPIVLQNMFVLLAGLLLGWKWGFASVSIYILAGIIGLPVFSSGGAGIGHILGPTGGYLLSNIPAVVVIGLISNGSSIVKEIDKLKYQFPLDLVAVIFGSMIIYTGGVPWLKYVTGMSWDKAIAVGVLPFIIGDVVKIIVILVIVKKLRKLIIDKS